MVCRSLGAEYISSTFSGGSTEEVKGVMCVNLEFGACPVLVKQGESISKEKSAVSNHDRLREESLKEIGEGLCGAGSSELIEGILDSTGDSHWKV